MTRRKALSAPFPPNWRETLTRGVSWYGLLDDAEQATMENLTRLFLDRIRFEGAGGMAIDDEVRVVIAYQACLLVLQLGIEWYRDVTSVIVYPSTVVKNDARGIGDGIIDDHATALSGEARLHGPMIIVWDTAARQARHPEPGRNVVFHEFAHKIDMYDGVADGMPALRTRSRQLEWKELMDQTLELLRSRDVPPLDPYGATNLAELFAVATEAFFESSLHLRGALPALYGMLSRFYGQDTAARVRR